MSELTGVLYAGHTEVARGTCFYLAAGFMLRPTGRRRREPDETIDENQFA